MAASVAARAVVAGLDDAPDLAVDELARLVGHLHGPAGAEVLLLAGRREHRHEADDVGHAPAPDHLARDARDLLEVGLGAGRDVAVDELLGRAPAERADDPALEVARVVAVAVGRRRLERHAERAPARDDRDLADRVGARLEHAEHGVAGLVVGGALALLVRQRDPPLGAEDDALERVGEVGGVDRGRGRAGRRSAPPR